MLMLMLTKDKKDLRSNSYNAAIARVRGSSKSSIAVYCIRGGVPAALSRSRRRAGSRQSGGRQWRRGCLRYPGSGE